MGATRYKLDYFLCWLSPVFRIESRGGVRIWCNWVWVAYCCQWNISGTTKYDERNFCLLAFFIKTYSSSKTFCIWSTHMVGSPWAGGGMVINWYQLIQSQESIQIIIVCINFIELLEWFKGTSLTSHSIMTLSLELLFMTRNRRLRCILKLCAGPASTFPSEKRFHLWHSREFFQL